MTDPIHLMLVDDEIDFRDAIARRLTKRGLSPRLAADGRECLEMLAACPADIVILDVKMPGMGGIEVLACIREKYPETEVIMLTGHASATDGVQGIKSGAFDYLTKPIELDHLIGKIRQAADKIERRREKQQEAALREKIRRQMIATERLAALGTLAAGVAHEINNPLAIIGESAGWMAQLLLRPALQEMPCKKDFHHALEKIDQSIKRARKITHQLLGFVKEQDTVISEINLPALIAETVDLVGHEARKGGIEIVQDPAEDAEVIWSDPYPLRQVLVNLITNAIHATPEKGKVFVLTRAVDAGIHLCVKDTGSGIPGEMTERIFEPFFSTKEPGRGTGLGLFVTRGIVERLGGKIEVESRVGHGALFRVILPWRPPVAKEHTQDSFFDMLTQIRGDTAHDQNSDSHIDRRR